uniref:THIF-type NAD/FAD binding fold domain-containing protein n=1 Tax=Romanomermis culicivorax TaxID=13658 RepID=A0A915KUG7_ROMCU
VDLDTIEFSNLNRQFLFRREHVGKPKAQVASETVKAFGPPDLEVQWHHKNITDPEFDVNFYKQFDFVLNALDNRAARNHVNRLCLATDIYLIESGSAGYLGQTTVIKKGVTECYECQAKAPPKSYPACTIRNTPSEPIHCIVWAKHLFNQLFGEIDPDEDVSPDLNDTEISSKYR